MINGGFFVLEPSVLELIDGAHTVWENEPLQNLAADGQLAAWIHRGFWQPMDTLRDKQHLNALWDSGAIAMWRWISTPTRQGKEGGSLRHECPRPRLSDYR